MEDDFKKTFTPPTESTKETNLRKTILFAALLFLVPFIAATLMGVFANQISPVKQKAKAAMAAEDVAQSNQPVCRAEADVTDLLAHRQILKESGCSVDSTNIRIWAAAGNQPALLISLPPPDADLDWNWRLSQDGMYALAIGSETNGSLYKQVALYCFADECWLWKNRLPWPESHESPWVFNSNTIIRSTKNNRRFAMEINPAGDIVSIDALGKGGPFPETTQEKDERFTETAIASKSNVYFVKDAQTQSLHGYALNTLPGLYDAGAVDRSTCFSGTGLLKFIANAGLITVSDTFTGIKLDSQNAWPASSNTVVTAMQSNRDGSELSLLMKTTFNAPQPVTREWCLDYQTESGSISINMTNAVNFVATPPSSIIETPDRQWIINLRDESILEIFDQATGKEVTKVDLKRHIPCRDNPVMEASLLAGESFILLKQSNRAFLLSLDSIIHYGDLLARLDVCRKILSDNTEEDLSQTNLTDNAMRELKSSNSNPASDNFNYEILMDYEMADPRTLEPPAKPSILSLQAELLASHHAWIYATCKIEQLIQIQERDNRAPRANPLLYTRYNLLAGDKKKAKQGCRKALDSLFYDTTPFNKMIRWQMLKTLFDDDRQDSR